MKQTQLDALTKDWLIIRAYILTFLLVPWPAVFLGLLHGKPGGTWQRQQTYNCTFCISYASSVLSANIIITDIFLSSDIDNWFSLDNCCVGRLSGKILHSLQGWICMGITESEEYMFRIARCNATLMNQYRFTLNWFLNTVLSWELLNM